MEINTRDFGPISVDESDVFDFPEGVYGFEEDTRFALFTRNFDDVPFLYLQSITNPIPCFIVFNPEDFYPGYSPLLSKEDLETCGAGSVDDLVFLLIANITESIEHLSLNIKSPVILNPKSKTGRQIILQNPDYSVRYRPFLKEGKEGV
ncbi:flagellar assembly protein FliW [Bacillota bacterium]